jgi:hypothetical protein
LVNEILVFPDDLCVHPAQPVLLRERAVVVLWQRVLQECFLDVAEIVAPEVDGRGDVLL